MYYPEELIDEIRESNDIVDVISEYVTLNKKGSNYFGLCPFHNEKTPSFSVNPTHQYFHCFGCGAGGNVYTFIMQIENYDFLESLNHLADRVHISLPSPNFTNEEQQKLQFKQILYDVNKEAAKFYFYQLHHSNKGKAAIHYLENRKISENTYKKFGLGYSTISRDDLLNYLLKKDFQLEAIKEVGLAKDGDNNKIYNRFFNRLMFPIFDVHNKIIGFGGRVLGEALPKYLNSPESLIYNKRKHLYGLNIARKTKKEEVLIVEGYLDVMSLHQAGFDNAVASLGTALTIEQSLLLKKYFKKAILIYDSDEAGIKAAQRAIPIIERAGLDIKIINIPEYKDPDEFIKNKGADAFANLLHTAKGSIEFEFDNLKHHFDVKTSEGKINIVNHISEKIAEMENKVAQDVYIKDVANELNVSADSIKQEVNKIIKNTGIVKNKINTFKKSDNHDGIAKAQKKLLAIILRQTNIYSIIRNYISAEDFLDKTYYKTANYIFEKLDNNEEVKLANVINLFTEIEEQRKVSGIFEEDINHESVIELEKLVNDLFKVIKKANIDYLVRNNDDITQLQKIINYKKQLQDIRISLNKA